jgi:hypothetical protein
MTAALETDRLDVGARPLIAARIRLYVAGSTPNSARAARNLELAIQALNDRVAGLKREVIDVFADSKQAMLDGVIVTPTLVAIGSCGRLVMIGDLGNAAELQALLCNLIAPDGAQA